MITYRRLALEDMSWDDLRAFNGASVFHTLAWINLLSDFYGAEPVIAAVQSDGQVQGYFTGLITRKYGLKILGSPFRDWSTYFMGFNLMPGVSFHEVLQTFPSFAFDELKCHLFEIIQMNLSGDEWKSLPYRIRKMKIFALNLTKSEEELLANMKKESCRRAIRRAIKKGVIIEEATDPGFADEYFVQYQEVMVKGMQGTDYGLDFVRQMITHLLPTGNLLLLRAKNSDGVCIATNIILVFNKVAVGWGGASFKKYQGLNPNELVYWYAMKRVKAMGVEVLHLWGKKKRFKEKFGAYETQAFRLMRARNPLLNIPLYAAFTINERMRLVLRRIIGW